jgi:hypothetical protein
MKNKTYHTIGTVKKSNRKITEAITNNNLKIILENMDGSTTYCLLYKNKTYHTTGITTYCLLYKNRTELLQSSLN